MEKIYKVLHIKNNVIKKIYVFIGTSIDDEYNGDLLNELFLKNPNDKKFIDIFDKNLLKNIKEKKIEVFFILNRIYADDSIETIKKKILKATNINFSFYDIYLFIKQPQILNATNVFDNLTQKNKLILTKLRLIELLKNINKSELIEKLQDKEVYTYNDIVDLNINNKEFIINKTIGHKFIVKDTNFPFFVNPYDVTILDDILDNYADSIVTTTNKNLLINFGPFADNNIYMCTADDVLSYANINKLSENSFIKIYYPHLYDNNVKSNTQLEYAKEDLLIKTQEMLTERYNIKEDNIAYLNNIYESDKTSISYDEKGIKTIEFLIHPENSFNLPLDVVFKLIKTTKQISFIKYNPGKQKEKMYRLYSNKLATNGKKIPYMKRITILKLMKQIGKSKSVTLYIEYLYKTTKIPIICEFIGNGDIGIKLEFDTSYQINEIDKILKNSINSVIDIVGQYIKHSGYSIRNFISLLDPNIEIINIDYFIKVAVKRIINLKEIVVCMSDIFNVSKYSIENGAEIRYKRVENYNEMDDQEAFISDLLNQTNTSENVINGTKIIEALQLNFNYKKKDAEEKYNAFISSLQVVQNAFENSKVKLKKSPGFKTTIEKDVYNNILFNVIGIDNINYIKNIEKYIDILLKLSQNPKLSTKCKSIVDYDSEDDNNSIEDIVNEQLDRQANIVDNAVVFSDLGEDEKNNDLDELFFNNEDESDEDESDEESSDNDEEKEELPDDYNGGTNENYEINLDNVSLRDYFSNRMKSRDEKLFVVEGEGNINSYSRTCNSTHRRQPVILTDKEKDRIDKEHPGSYHKDSAIKYGSSPENQHWYICPRYWSIKDNTSLTEKEALSGEYGDIIPEKAKNIPKGANIYEFNEKLYHVKKDGTYKMNYPGYLEPNKNNDGLCAPCCFGSYLGKQQSERRKQCKINEEIYHKKNMINQDSKSDTIKKNEEQSNDNKSDYDEEYSTIQKKYSDEDYIKGPEKFPLQSNRYGYLPPALENFLKTENKLCYVSKSNNNLKMNHMCILRKGVDNHKTQSFISCIADIINTSEKKPRLTINEMKEVLITKITYDVFVNLQNGNLVNIFYDATNNEINEDFKKTKLYKKLKSVNSDTSNYINSYFKKVISAHNNFISFLRDDTVIIDHTYLWDLLCMPNILSSIGYNMVILEIIDDDITNKIDVLCPSNSYSSNFFDEDKKKFILLKKNKYFEPIYVRKDDEEQRLIIRTFDIKDKNLLKNIKNTFKLIKDSYDKCEGLESRPYVYKFKRNITLDKLVNILKSLSFIITKYIFNYNGKVIAVEVEKDKYKGIIPCFPSAPIIDLEQIKYIWINDVEGYDYDDTINFLNYINDVSNKKILSKPEFKVLGDNADEPIIVGVITETNQFIPVIPKQNIYNDDLKTIKSEDYNIIDGTISKDFGDEDAIDIERINYVKKIKLESSFYKIFRNIIRSVLGEYKNIDVRKEIEELISNNNMLYINKLELIKDKLVEISENVVFFSEFDDDILNDIKDIKQCYDNDDDRHICFKTKDTKENSILIPKYNLINIDDNKDNEEIYYGRIADELIRYNRIKAFIFEPKSFLSLSNIEYDLHDKEIILLESLLTNEYFDDIVEYKSNEYIKNNTFDTSQPIKTQIYTSDYFQNGNSISADNKSDNNVLKTKVKSKSKSKIVLTNTTLKQEKKPKSKTKSKIVLASTIKN